MTFDELRTQINNMTPEQLSQTVMILPRADADRAEYAVLMPIRELDGADYCFASEETVTSYYT